MSERLYRSKDGATEDIVRRRQEVYTQHHDTAGTLIAANFALAAFYTSLLFYLVRIEHITKSNFENGSWIGAGVFLWFIVIGLCFVSRHKSRQRKAALSEMLDVNGLWSPLPPLKDFNTRFHTTPLRANIIAAEISTVVAFIVIVPSLVVTPPTELIVTLGFVFISSIGFAYAIHASNGITRIVLDWLGDECPNRFEYYHENVYRSSPTSPDKELRATVVVLTVAIILTVVYVGYLSPRIVSFVLGLL